MPSRKWQQGIIVESKKKNSNGQRQYVLVAKKTGFMDVTINGTRYYYNASATNQPMTQRNIVQRVVNQNTTNQRRTITITRKGG